RDDARRAERPSRSPAGAAHLGRACGAGVRGSCALHPTLVRVRNGVSLERGRALPVFPLADAEAGIAARIGRAAEADLVPRPGVGVEGRERLAHDHRPGPRAWELVPDLPMELAVGERLDHVVLDLVGGADEIRGPVLAGGRVQSDGNTPEGHAVVRHVRVAVALAFAGEELGVDEFEDGDPRLAVLS